MTTTFKKLTESLGYQSDWHAVKMTNLSVGDKFKFNNHRSVAFHWSVQIPPEEIYTFLGPEFAGHKTFKLRDPYGKLRIHEWKNFMKVFVYVNPEQEE